jgi:hypothetical protein
MHVAAPRRLQQGRNQQLGRVDRLQQVVAGRRKEACLALVCRFSGFPSFFDILERLPEDLPGTATVVPWVARP